jgi:hypothetical protein
VPFEELAADEKGRKFASISIMRVFLLAGVSRQKRGSAPIRVRETIWSTVQAPFNGRPVNTSTRSLPVQAEDLDILHAGEVPHG